MTHAERKVLSIFLCYLIRDDWVMYRKLFMFNVIKSGQRLLSSSFFFFCVQVLVLSYLLV